MARGYNGTTHAHAIPDLTGLTDVCVHFRCIPASLSTTDFRSAVVFDNFPTTPRHSLQFYVCQSAADLPLFGADVDGTGGTTAGAASFGLGAFRSVVLTRTGTAARCHLDDVQMGSDVTVGAAALNLTGGRVGCHNFSGADQHFGNVHVGELAFWDAVLTSADRAALAAGVSPLFVKPGNLLRYYPMVRELGDVFGGTALTVASGAPDVVEHPRVYYPVPPAALPFGGAAAGFDSAAFPYDEAVPPVRRRPAAVSY